MIASGLLAIKATEHLAHFAVSQLWMTEYCYLDKWVLFYYEWLPQNALVRMKGSYQGHTVIILCVCVSFGLVLEKQISKNN